MKPIRMLAAIMFTDMVGYTSLMQKDESKAKILRDKHRSILEKFDKAFDLLESACDKKLGGMNFINGKYWKEIHDHPRFKLILEKMNLPLE